MGVLIIIILLLVGIYSCGDGIGTDGSSVENTIRYEEQINEDNSDELITGEKGEYSIEEPLILGGIRTFLLSVTIR